MRNHYRLSKGRETGYLNYHKPPCLLEVSELIPINPASCSSAPLLTWTTEASVSHAAGLQAFDHRKRKKKSAKKDNASSCTAVGQMLISQVYIMYNLTLKKKKKMHMLQFKPLPRDNCVLLTPPHCYFDHERASVT